MLTMTPMLGDASISQSALAVVRALENDDWTAAAEAFGQHTGSNLTEVARQAVVLGADETAVQAIVESLGAGEVIEVSSTAPPAPKPFPAPTKAAISWLLILLAIGAVGYGAYRYRKL